MPSGKGVEIIVRLRWATPPWLVENAGRIIRSERAVGKKMASAIILPDAKARFRPDGRVEVLLPQFRQFRITFGPYEVYQIRSRQGEVLEENEFLCDRCSDLTGETVPAKTGKENESRPRQIRCTTPRCRNQWTWKDV